MSIPDLNSENYSFVDVMETPHVAHGCEEVGLTMDTTTKVRPTNLVASAFLASASRRSLRPNVWAEAGQAIEMAHCSALPFGRVARLLIVLCSAIMVKILA